MAWQLIALYRAGGDTTFVHFSEFVGARGAGSDFTIARYWGLIERPPSDDDGKKHSGEWRLTMQGIKFVEEREKIVEAALVFDNEVLRFDGELVSIVDCLGEKFNYQELMKG